MNRLTEESLGRALRRQPLPEVPPPDALLASATSASRPRSGPWSLPVLAAAALVLVTLPLWAPAPAGSEAWSDGLAERGAAFAEGLLARLGG